MPTTITIPKMEYQKLQRIRKQYEAIRELVWFDLSKDPDAGLKLRKSTIDRIRRSERQARAGKVHTFEEVARELGIVV